MPLTERCYPSLICRCPFLPFADEWDAQTVSLALLWIVPPMKFQGNLLTPENLKDSRKDAKSKVLGCCFSCSKDLLDLANYTAYQSKRSLGAM